MADHALTEVEAEAWRKGLVRGALGGWEDADGEPVVWPSHGHPGRWMVTEVSETLAGSLYASELDALRAALTPSERAERRARLAEPAPGTCTRAAPCDDRRDLDAAVPGNPIPVLSIVWDVDEELWRLLDDHDRFVAFIACCPWCGRPLGGAP